LLLAADLLDQVDHAAAGDNPQLTGLAFRFVAQKGDEAVERDRHDLGLGGGDLRRLLDGPLDNALDKLGLGGAGHKLFALVGALIAADQQAGLRAEDHGLELGDLGRLLGGHLLGDQQLFGGGHLGWIGRDHTQPRRVGLQQRRQQLVEAGQA